VSSGTLALSWGPYGGFYVTQHRICLGWAAITLLPENEIDELMRGFVDYWDAIEDGRIEHPTPERPA
jgi:hypothetical protein